MFELRRGQLTKRVEGIVIPRRASIFISSGVSTGDCMRSGGEDVYSTLRWKLYLNICISIFCATVPTAGRTAKQGTRLKTGHIFQKITQRGRQWVV